MALDPRYCNFYGYPRFQYPNYPNALWQKYDCRNTPSYVEPRYYDLPYDPIRGRYGTAEVSLKGYVTNDSCQYGYFPANMGGRGACCNVYGECGIGDRPL